LCGAPASSAVKSVFKVNTTGLFFYKVISKKS